jgi:hypothetical protein
MGLLSVVGGNRALDAGSGTRVRPRQPAGRLCAFPEGFGAQGGKFRIPADAPTDNPPFTALSAPAAVQAGPAFGAAAKKAAIQSPSSSTNPLFSRITNRPRTLRARSLPIGGRPGATIVRFRAGKTSPERADTDGQEPFGAGWRSPRETELRFRVPVCGTSEWCVTDADPAREGAQSCLNLRSRRKTVLESGSASAEAGRNIFTPIPGVGTC